MSLNEILRQEYLETMGIQSYFPRFVLPGAKRSVQSIRLEGFSMPSDAQTINVEAIDEPLEDAIGESIAALVQNVPASPAPIPTPIPASSSNEAKSGAKSEDARFQFAFIRVNKDLCILNQIPYVGIKQQLSVGHKTLLLNILKALKLYTEEVDFGALTFRWPLVEGKHVDKSADAARDSLSTYLDQQMAARNSKVLLVMGALAASYTLPEDKQDEFEKNSLYQIEAHSWKIATIRSLDEIFSMPQVKKEVWRQLQKLNLSALN